MNDIGRVEHRAVADRHRLYLLLAGIAQDLRKSAVDGAAAPGEGTRSLHLDNQPLDAEVGEDNVSEIHLIVKVAQWPVENRGEQVLQNVLCHFFVCCP